MLRDVGDEDADEEEEAEDEVGVVDVCQREAVLGEVVGGHGGRCIRACYRVRDGTASSVSLNLEMTGRLGEVGTGRG